MGQFRVGRRPARVFLVGFPASGKSTYGQRWASAISVPFADSDAWITAHSGASPEKWLLEYGEQTFREIEAQAIEAILKTPPPVLIALGGGSVTIPHLMAKLKEAGWLVWIDPPWHWLLERLRQNPRPLLCGRPESEWQVLWQKRRPYYRLADLHWPPHLIPENIIQHWLQNILTKYAHP